MPVLTLLEKAFFYTAVLLLVFGLTELGILAQVGRYSVLPDEAKTPSGVAVTVAGTLALVDGVLCMLYTGILAQKVWMNPTPSEAKVRTLLHWDRICVLC